MTRLRFIRWSRMSLMGLMLVLCAILARAQVDTGTILGTVTDTTGAVIPGATVTLISQETSATLNAKTTTDGRFEFTPLHIGTYNILAEAANFKRLTIQGIKLDIQQQALVNIMLHPGAVSESVEVTEAPELLQTQSSSVGQVMEQKTIEDLPLNGRDYTMLVLLTPGVTVPQNNARASNQFVANGARVAQNNYLLDGIDNNSNSVDYLDGKADVIKPPVDAIAEFNTMTSDFPAEFGRAGGAIVNATLKSGSNQFHGDVWEFFRNDALDANDNYRFNGAPATPNGELRQNQFGVTAGGRLWKDKTFLFGDYEGTRIRVGQNTGSMTVPTSAESGSGFTNFQDLLNATGSFTRKDVLGRTYQNGQIFDPATTRQVTGGGVDPVTGLLVLPASAGGLATGQVGYVRDPFNNNQIPSSRLDPNAVKLLQLYPAPNVSSVQSNYSTVKVDSYDTDTADMRIDQHFRDKDQAFFHYDYISSVRSVLPPFAGVADGGAYADGLEIFNVRGFALGYTHMFSPTLVNEARAGYTRGHDTRNPSGSTTMGIPAQFGITGIPQLPLNGGLPYLGISTLSGLGGSGWLPGNRFSDTEQMTENLTKVYKHHTFKGGAEFQYVYFPWLAPPASKGNFYWDGNYTSMPLGEQTGANAAGVQTDGSTARAQFLINPGPAQYPTYGGVNMAGGMDQFYASNFGTVHAGRNYFGFYFQDDWAITRKLTLNLGLRWEHFGLTGESGGAQANFVQPSLTSNAGAELLIPANEKNVPLSTSFINTLAQDGIALVYTNKYGSGLGIIQKLNFAPRLGFAYSLTPKWVVRGAYGIFYDGFENRGGYPSLGYNYPFQFEVGLTNTSNGGIPNVTPVTYPDGSTGTLERGMSGDPLTPATISASGLTFRGIQLNYQTPYSQGFNIAVQYELTSHDSLEAAYVGSQARHLEASTSENNVFKELPPGTPETGYVSSPGAAPQNFIPFPHWGAGSPYFGTTGNSNYNSLQTKWTHRAAGGLNLLLGYTIAQAKSDAGDSLANGQVGGYRAPGILPVTYDMALADFNMKNQFVGSGTYALPVGRGKEFLGNLNTVEQEILGGWNATAILTFDSGQPQTIGSQVGPGTGISANAVVVPGVNKYRAGITGMYNPAAFTSPPVVSSVGDTSLMPFGGPPTQVNGPGYKDFDFSIFKSFEIKEASHADFRAEVFNLTNTPSFNNPSNTNYNNQALFGNISSLRSTQRVIQLAFKYYW
jgi:hypothetical protein